MKDVNHSKAMKFFSIQLYNLCSHKWQYIHQLPGVVNGRVSGVFHARISASLKAISDL